MKSQKIPQRKQRKRERRSKDRRPRKKRIKDDKELDELAKIISSLLPTPKFIGKKFKCEECNQFYCIGADGIIQFCRDCYIVANYKDACLKLSNGKIMTCKHCEEVKWNALSVVT